MNQVRWSPEAIADLESIREFIARDSAHYARLVVQRLVDAVERLSDFPESGRVVPELARSDIREVIVGAYRVVYRYRENTVEVATVFRGTRLFPISR